MAFLTYVRDGLAALDSGGTAREHHEKIGMVEEIKGAAASAQLMSSLLLEAEVVARRTEAGVRGNNPAYGWARKSRWPAGNPRTRAGPSWVSRAA